MQGKESVALDLKKPEAVQIVHQLAGRVDAVVEGFRDGAARRIRVDEDTLRAINPDLVYLSARGYGVEGPCGDRAAFAPSFGAAGGIAAAHLGGTVPDDPNIAIREVSEHSAVLRAASASRYASADGIAALGVASALLVGLWHAGAAPAASMSSRPCSSRPPTPWPATWSIFQVRRVG